MQKWERNLTPINIDWHRQALRCAAEVTSCPLCIRYADKKKNEESHYLKNQRSYPRSGKLLRRSCSWNLTDGSVLSKIKIKKQLVISLDKLLQSVYWHVSRYLCQRGCLPLIRVGMEPLWCILVQIGISVYESCIESIIN